MKNPEISLIIPAKDEEESIETLYKKLVDVLEKIKKGFEIVFVDDGSKDKTFEKLKALNKKDKRVKIVKLRGNWGKSTALLAGFDYSRGDIVITMDADLQDDPAEIPKFLEELNKGYDLVSGWKKVRFDPWHKVIPSRILNFISAKMTRVNLHDINCGFKAYRREVVQNLNLYGELYRFIPILVAKKNFRVGEVVVKHRTRRYGKTKYGIERNIKGFLDLLTVVFITGYFKRPGHFFGTLGFISFSIGFIIGLYISYLRFTTGSIQYRHPLLFLGILLMVIGVQLVSTGLLAELIIHSRKREDSKLAIEKII